MKRKLLLGSAVVPALLASGAMAQVVNFHDANNGDPVSPVVGIVNYYNELFAGQGAYADPGNDIWNGFGQYGGYQSTIFYSGSPGAGGNWPQQFGNPGNPYAAYNGGAGWVSSTGSSLFDYSGSHTNSGNATSSGQWTPITLSVKPYAQDNGNPAGTGLTIPNGPPAFLMLEAAVNGGSEVFTLHHVPAGAYGLYLYGASYDDNRGTAFSLNSGQAHHGITATLNGQNGAPAATFVEGRDFVIFENVTPDTNGNITITASPNPEDGLGNTNLAGETDVNGFQLIFNPPPTAVGCTAAQNVRAGGTASFSFSPAFAAGASFRWQFISGGVTYDLSDGVSVAGSATTNLTIGNVSTTNVGLYQCRMTTATATNTSPAAPLTILTSAATGLLQAGDPITAVGNVLHPGDILSEFNNTISAPYNSIPPPFNMGVNHVEDGTLIQCVNFGANAGAAPFAGPVGFIVTPQIGATVVTGLRFFTSGSHAEDDPADYLLEGSNDGGTNFTTISGGLLGLPAQRNAAGGPINVTNQVLKEIDFANSAAYGAYRLTFTNVNNNVTASNGLQVAEVQLLGSLPPAAPVIAQQPEAAEILWVGTTFHPSVAADGAGPLSYQWYYNTSQQIAQATNATLTLADVQTTNSGSYTCTISSPYGSTNSTALNLTVVIPNPYQAAVMADEPLAFFPLNETSGTTAYDYAGGYDGVYSNSPALGLPGPSSFLPFAAGFDGASQSVYVPETPALNFGGQVTLEAWIQPGTQSDTLSDILAKGYDANQNTDELQMRVQGTFFDGGADGTGGGGAAGGVVTPNWTHLVLTWDGTYWNLYVNALLVGTGANTVGALNFSDPWAIADGTASGDTRFYAGNISAAAIYNHALTPSRVGAHYNVGLFGTTNLPPTVSVPSASIKVDQGGDGSIMASVTGPEPFFYQWFYTNGGSTVLIPAGTNSTLQLTDVQTLQASYQYFLVVSNAYGAATSSFVALNVLSGPPVLVADVSPALTEVPAGVLLTFSVRATGTEPFFYQWSDLYGPIAGATNSSYTFPALAGADQYGVTVSNASGSIPSAMAFVEGLGSPPPVLGFNGTGANWTRNRGNIITPTISSNVLTLTDGQNNEASSAFYNTPQYIDGFIAAFTYTAGGNRGADGITFCLQNYRTGKAAVGGLGLGLGYNGISNSAAFEMNLYGGSAGGVGIQFGTNGATAQTTPSTGPYFGTGLVNIANGDPIYVFLYYGQDVLTVWLADPMTGNSYTTSFMADLPAIVHGSSAFVGFTGGTGGANSIQKISNFVFAYTTPPMLSVTPGSAGSVVVSWPVSVSTLFGLQQSTAVNGPWSNVTVTPVIVNSENQVTLTPGTKTAFFRLALP